MGILDRFIARMIEKKIFGDVPNTHRKLVDIAKKALDGKLTEDDIKDIDMPENVKEFLLAVSETMREVENNNASAVDAITRVAEKIGAKPEDLIENALKLYK